MGRRIQVTIDDSLDHTIRANADLMGVSVSSYVRNILTQAVPTQTLLKEGMRDYKAGRVEKISLQQFDEQINSLL